MKNKTTQDTRWGRPKIGKTHMIERASHREGCLRTANVARRVGAYSSKAGCWAFACVFLVLFLALRHRLVGGRRNGLWCASGNARPLGRVAGENRDPMRAPSCVRNKRHPGRPPPGPAFHGPKGRRGVPFPGIGHSPAAAPWGQGGGDNAPKDSVPACGGAKYSDQRPIYQWSRKNLAESVGSITFARVPLPTSYSSTQSEPWSDRFRA